MQSVDMAVQSKNLIKLKNLLYFSALLLFSIFASIDTTAFAQSSASDPTRIQERIEQNPEGRATETRTPTPPKLRAAEPDAPEYISPDSTPDSRFVLAAVIFSGLKAFAPADFAAYYEPYLAAEIGTDELQSIANNITEHYRTRGFFLSRAIVEPQDLAFGVLNIRIVEGRIDQVQFKPAEGGDGDFTALLSPYVAKITAKDGPANVNVIERYLLLMNDLPGLSAKANVEALDRDKGSYALNIDVSKTAVSGSYGVDNRGTRAIGRDEASIALTANGWLTGRDSTRATIFTVPSSPNELAYVELMQAWALGTEGTSVSLTGSYSTIDAGADEKDNDLNSSSTRAVLQIRHPLIRSREENLTLYGNVGMTRQKERDFGVLSFEDRLQVARLGAEYYVDDDFKGSNYGTLWVSRGLGINDARGDDPNRSRVGARPVFTKVYARAERRQVLSDMWAFKVSLAGQAADQRLLSNEEFSLGGWLYGRGYDGGELSGTHGAAGAAELQFGDSVDLGVLTSYQFYGFYDGGVVWETAENSYNGHRESLTSTGLGVRLTFTDLVNAGIELAQPLTLPAENVGDGGDAPRLFMYLNGRF